MNSDEIQKIRDEHKQNSDLRSRLFNRRQKEIAAKAVAETMGLNGLLDRMCFVCGDTNHICVDYIVFKTFAHPENFVHISRKMQQAIEQVLQNHSSFIVHVNLESLTLSAMQRYKDLFTICETICTENRGELGFVPYLDQWCVYNCPKMMKDLLGFIRPFLNRAVIDKVYVVDENTCAASWSHLLSDCGIDTFL